MFILSYRLLRTLYMSDEIKREGRIEPNHAWLLKHSTHCYICSHSKLLLSSPHTAPPVIHGTAMCVCVTFISDDIQILCSKLMLATYGHIALESLQRHF